MLKKLIFIIFISTGIFLVGCGEKKVIIDDVKSTECYGNAYANSDTSTVRCGNGYYTLRGNGKYIAYVSDADLDNEIFLCGKPECNHMSDTLSILPDCDAYLGNAVLDSISCYDEQIYVLILENAEAVLYRISKDGSRHERLLAIGDMSVNQSGTYYYIVDGDTVYVLHRSEGYKDDDINQISKFSIATGEKEVLIEEKAVCSALMLYNGNIFYKKSDYKDLNSNVIRRIDLSTGKAEDVVAGTLGRYTIDNLGNRLLYWRLETGLVSYNLGTGEERVLRKSDDEFIRVRLACNGRYVCVDNYLTLALDIEKNIPHLVDVIDVESGELVTTLDMDLRGEISGLCSIDKDRIVGTGHFRGEFAVLELSDLEAGDIKWKKFGYVKDRAEEQGK